MIFKSLILHNFGIYSGTHKIDFHHDKPITLIGGINGRGKTTILEAIILALYGKNSFLFREEKQVSYSQYLMKFVNKADLTNKCYIQIDFIQEDNDGAEYSVKRQWSSARRILSDGITVTKNGIPDPFLQENWISVIEGILPSEIAKFFFFDGEKIAALASDTTNEELKKSIKSMLGLNILDTLQKDLLKIIKRSERTEDSFKQNSSELDHEQSSLEEISSEIERHQKISTELEIQIQKSSTELEEVMSRFNQLGGNIAKDREKHLTLKNSYEIELSQIKNQLLTFAGEALPLKMVKQYLLKILDSGKQAEKVRKNAEALEQLKKTYKKYKHHSKEMDDFILYFSKQNPAKTEEKLLDVNPDVLLQIESLISKDLDLLEEKVKQTLSRRSKLNEMISVEERYLSVEIDTDQLDSLQIQINDLNKEIGAKTALKTKNQEELAELERKFGVMQKKHLKAVSESINALELSEKRDRLIKYTHLALKTAESYQLRLQKNKIEGLAKIMTKCYKKLANKKLLIDHIEIDSETLDFSYISPRGVQISTDVLSAGEKQLMVISLLWALAIVSKKSIPVVIDTPLARLDKKHRELIVENYYPFASKQVIILTTDTEITEDYYRILKPHLSDEYILNYDESSQSTTINQGYFLEAAYDYQTDQIIN